MGRRSNIAMLAGPVATGFVASASAEVNYSVDVGAGHSNNITRVETGEIDETLASAGLTLEWQDRRPRLRSDVSIDADYVYYADDTYDGEIIGGLDGTLDFALIPERLRWIVQDSFGQEQSDPFSPVTPETREDVNYFTTGPSLEFLLGRQLARIFGTYSQSNYERSPFDSERLLGGLSVGRTNPEGRGYSVNLVTEEVTFDQPGNTDYDRHSAYGSYSVGGARTEIEAEVGYTWLKLESGDDSDAPLFRLDITRELSSASTLQLRLGTQLTDSSEALRQDLGQDTSPGTGPGVSSTADPYENRYASLAWNFNRHRTSLGLSVDYTDNTYETQSQLDRRQVGYAASFGRAMSSRLSLSITGNLVDEEFDLSGLSVNTLEYGGALDWQLGPTIGLRLSLTRSERDTDDNTGQYTEDRAFLSFVYRSGTARRPGERAE